MIRPDGVFRFTPQLTSVRIQGSGLTGASCEKVNGPLLEHRPRRHRLRRPILPPHPHHRVAAGKEAGGEETRHGPILFHLRDLIVAQKRRVDEHWPMVVHAVLGDRFLDRLERLIGRGVAVHVHVDLEVGRPEAIEGRLEDLVGDLPIGPVFSGLAWGIGGIGLVHPGGVEATVEPELHPAKAHPIDVAPVEIGPGREQPLRHVPASVPLGCRRRQAVAHASAGECQLTPVCGSAVANW